MRMHVVLSELKCNSQIVIQGIHLDLIWCLGPILVAFEGTNDLSHSPFHSFTGIHSSQIQQTSIVPRNQRRLPPAERRLLNPALAASISSLCD